MKSTFLLFLIVCCIGIVSAVGDVGGAGATGGATGGAGGSGAFINPMAEVDKKAKVYTIGMPNMIEIPNPENPTRVAEKNWQSLFWQFLPPAPDVYNISPGVNYSSNSYVSNYPLYQGQGYTVAHYPSLLII